LLTNFEIMLSPFSSKVNFLSDGVNIKIPDKISLMRFIEEIFKNEKKRLCSVTYVFCSDRKLRKINKEYLGHNYFTDIITFDLSENGAPVSADIYISVDRIRKNAKNLNQSYKSEFHRVVFHGVLHLCGYKDKNRTDVFKMRKMEEKYLNKYFKVSRDTVSL
jgi:probable rRNA maturation factor